MPIATVKQMNNQIDLQTLYARLSQLGLNEEFVRSHGLPDWWCPEFEATDSAVVTAVAYISGRFNLDLRSLLNPDLSPTFRELPRTKFKAYGIAETNHDVSASEISPERLTAHNLAFRIAELVAFAYQRDYCAIAGMTASSIRTMILKKYGCVSLEGLLDFCAVYGIPVAHFENFPSSQITKTFHGIVTNCDRRPVIVVSLGDRDVSHLASDLAFVIAHELGHIALNHLDNNETISEADMMSSNSIDAEESLANQFARKLIGDDGGGNLSINQYLSQWLDWESLSNDNQEYLALALGLDITEVIKD
jgi:hypothetical protein